MELVYITKELPHDILDPLYQGYEVEVWRGRGPVPRGVLLESVSDAVGLLCMLNDSIDAELLDAAPNLRVISQMAVGVDNIDVEECARRGIPVGHTPGVLTETVADTAFALLAAIVRRIPEGERAVREGRWGPWEPFWMTGADLHGTVLGIVGMGRIGRAVARRACGFDMEVVYTSRRPKPDVDAQRLSLSELLVRADAVVLTVALTPQTRGMIGEAELKALGSDSYLVNVARGPVVQTEALVTALAEGWIAGAALDVTDPEPLPSDHPLLDYPNCLVVPHIGSASVRTRRAMATMAVENLIAGLEGRKLPARYATAGSR